MATPGRRVTRFLSSRRLAVVLIAAVAAYGVLATLVPRGAPTSPEVTAWALEHPVAEAIVAPLGLHRAYSSPLFLGLVTLLAACTTACALERTRRAARLSRSFRSEPTDAIVDRLAQRPESVIPVVSSATSEALVTLVKSRLAEGGLSAKGDGNYVTARAGVVGLLGSPLFHWSIVALMLVTAAGQATRAEGFLALPLAKRVAEVHESYLQVVEGPLFGERHTGVEIEMTELSRKFVRDGVDYGASPYVKVYRNLEPIAEGWVHPNSPLRAGSLMIHMAAFGPAVTLAVESTGGAEVAREDFALDRTEDAAARIRPQVFNLSDETGTASLAVRVTVLPKPSAEGSATESRAQLETATVGSATFGPPVVVPESSALDLPDGRRLRVVDVSDWARVSVANDWSVPFIYGLLVLAILGLAVAVLVPARRASVLLVETDEGRFLHVGTWHDKRDPAFNRRVLDAVTAAAVGPEEE